jgi:hypothetical protein
MLWAVLAPVLAQEPTEKTTVLRWYCNTLFVMLQMNTQ